MNIKGRIGLIGRPRSKLYFSYFCIRILASFPSGSLLFSSTFISFHFISKERQREREQLASEGANWAPVSIAERKTMGELLLSFLPACFTSLLLIKLCLLECEIIFCTYALVNSELLLLWQRWVSLLSFCLIALG